ncbi:uncharacterized protein L969DRAFT_84565 [Mixia osmundae IAM 14324]|uniref:Peptidase M24 domain-containing protein n=1 Tax=Mixia osmundae (strain CBS 9802 / IAM 14324 / JCM 22182 / KY 12970) TaxID=764103 RepID=G7E7B4_MIXOS|nr:uncharacterized protein L969DRAFT_84565 [Mixia osmundae IAM 14324]KEI42692.1 hypothetical protein L969DRAFT_84565 [Mixia osmundae IAM 14324]GAA98724.1 hypothetical protein E5Q_05412 [Mixia osmundae IAM 14324]
MAEETVKTGETAAPAAQKEAVVPAVVLDKYKAASSVVGNALKHVLSLLVDSALILDIVTKGDQAITDECANVYNKTGAHKVAKGISHPTCISVNNVVAHYSPLPSDSVHSITKLSKGDLVKVVMGAHIDGYASIAAETIVVGASKEDPVTGRKADLIAAAHHVAEAALRSAKVGGKNWEVTDGAAKVLHEYAGKLKGIEGMSSHQHLQNDIYAKKTITVFPTSEGRRDSDNNFLLEEGDVFALDVIVTSGEEGKAKATGNVPTTVYGKTSSAYQLKMKTSRATFSEVSKKAGSFPFSLRILDDERRAKLGMQECVQHGLMKPFDVYTADKSSDLVAQVMVTFMLGKTGVTRLSHTPHFFSAELVKPDTEIKSEEVKALLSQPLKVDKKKAAKKAKKAAEAA